MPASLIALLSALGLVATGGVAVATVSVVANTAQEQTMKTQDEELTKLQQAMDELRKLKDGQDGQDGKAGLDGSAGPAGPQGTSGIAGAAGPKGEQGVDGADGIDGLDGSNGANGANGSNGANGANGANGRDAERYVEAFYSSLPSVSSIPLSSTETLVHAPATRVGTGYLMNEDATTLQFEAIYSGTYLVHYSIVAPQNGPTALTQITAAQNGSLVPGSISSMYTSTGSQASASFYVHLSAGDVLRIGGSTSTFASVLVYIPSVSFQVVEFDDGVVYCDPLVGCAHP